MGRKRTVNFEDKKFWNVVYNELLRSNSNEKYHAKYIAIPNSKRYTEVYPVGDSDLKVYSVDSVLGLDVAKEVANHFDLDIVIKNENTQIGIIACAIVKIPKAIMYTIYNDDYED